MSESQKIIKYCAIGLALILAIASGIMYGISFMSNVFGSNNTIKDLTETNITDNIYSLDIDLRATNLTIKEGEKFAVETNNDYIKIIENNDKLIIKESKTYKITNNNELIIYVPAYTKFSKVDIDAGAGNLSLNVINTDKLDLELGAGNTSISNINVVREASIDAGVGKLEITSGTISNLDLELGVGETIIKSALLGRSSIEAGVGAIKLDIIGSKIDYRIIAEKGIGSINVDGESIKNKAVIGDGENSINVEGGIGSIDIKFIKEF